MLWKSIHLHRRLLLSEIETTQSKTLDERLKYLTNLVFPAISEKAKATQKQMLETFNHSHHITEFPIGSLM